jgi:hypothetical protein
MAEQRIISADSHFVEPPNMWAERIDKKFRDRAPHTVKGLNGKDGEFFVCENISPLPVAAAFGAGVPSEQLPEHNKRGRSGSGQCVGPGSTAQRSGPRWRSSRGNLHDIGNALVRVG